MGDGRRKGLEGGGGKLRRRRGWFGHDSTRRTCIWKVQRKLSPLVKEMATSSPSVDRTSGEKHQPELPPERSNVRRRSGNFPCESKAKSAFLVSDRMGHRESSSMTGSSSHLLMSGFVTALTMMHQTILHETTCQEHGDIRSVVLSEKARSLPRRRSGECFPF